MDIFDSERVATALGNLDGDIIRSVQAAIGPVIATGMGSVGGPAFWLLSTCFAGLAQEKAVEGGELARSRLQDLADSLEDEEAAVLSQVGAGLRAISTALPDGDRWNEAAIQSANGNPDELVDLLAEYSSNPDRRDAFEQTVEGILLGEESSAFDSGDELLEHLQTELNTADRSEALATFLDIRDLVVSREVHETLETLHDVSLDVEQAREELQAANEQLSRLLNRELRNQGFRRVDEAYYRLHEPRSLSEAWRIGMRPIDVRAGHGIEREVKPRRETPADMESDADPLSAADVVKQLQGGQDLLLLGKPGAGKSTFCRLVIDHWQRDSHGTVLYRPSGTAKFDEPGTLRDAIRNSIGHVLVVVDDAVRPNAQRIFAVANELETDPSVNFLFNARYNEFSEFTPTARAESDLTLELQNYLETVDKLELAKLRTDQCQALVTHFEAETGIDTEFNPQGLVDQLYQGELDTETGDAAGSMLQLVYRLFGSAEGVTGLEADVQAKFEQLEHPDPGQGVPNGLADIDTELRRTAGIFISLLNAAPDVELRPTYLAALSASLDKISLSDVRELINVLDGWLLFRHGDNFETMHEFWSFLYLRYAVAGPPHDGHAADPPIDATAAHERFATCVDAMEQLFTGNVDIDGVFFSLETARPDELDLRPTTLGESILPAFYEIGVTRPVLVPLYQSRGRSRIDPEAVTGCSDETAVRIRSKIGRMLRKQGEHEYAERQFETASDIIAETDTPEAKRAEAYRCNQHAAVFRVRDDLARAEDLSKRSLQLAQDANAPAQEIRARNYLAIVYRNRGQRERQWQMYQQSLKIARDRGYKQLEGSTLNNIGWILRDGDEAEQAHLQALHIARSVGDRNEEARALRSLGDMAARAGETEAAVEYLSRALSIYREIGSREAEGWVLRSLAQVRQEQGRSNEARREGEQALSIFQELEHDRGIRLTQEILDDITARN